MSERTLTINFSDGSTFNEPFVMRYTLRKNAGTTGGGSDTGTASAPKAYIENLTQRHNRRMRGGRGLQACFTFRAHYLKGKDVKVVLKFRNRKTGRDLRDRDGKYRTSGGTVAAFTPTLRPRYEKSIWKKLCISMPYKQLHLKLRRGKTHRVQFHAYAYTYDSVTGYQELDRTRYYSFRLRR